MQTKIVLLILVSLVVACSPQIPASSTPTIPTPAPTRAPARTATPPPVIALTAPAVQQHVPLSNLPGAGRDPYAIAQLGDKVYTANATTDNVAVIQNDRVVKFIPVGKDPVALAADPAHNRLYVANADDQTISLIVHDQVTLTTRIGADARALLFFENRLFVGLDSADGILLLDPATLQTQARISIPNTFTIISLAGDAAHHRIYANLYDKTAVIDSTTLRVTAILPTKGSYETLLADPQNGSVLIAIYDSRQQSQSLVAFDPLSGSVRGRAALGGDPRGAAIRADGTRVYVANSFSRTVTVIDPRTMSVIATIPVDLDPSALALDENGRRLYVANMSSDNLSVIDTDANQVVGVIPLAMIPTALLANETAGRVYVANASTDSVYVIEGARVVKEIPVGRHPIDLARDAESNRLFVANEGDGTLSVIDESNFSVRATAPITRDLTTVAVDAAHARLFANSVILDLKSLSPIGALTMRGTAFAPVISPDFIRVNPNNHRIYANGGNGVPGSNGRLVTYSIDGDTLQQRGVLDYNGDTLFFAIDPASNRVYLAGRHPLALTNTLSVFDANDQRVLALPLPARTTGIAYNPQTHHLFLSHAESDVTSNRPSSASADNTIQILDTTSFGEVARLAMDSPGVMARLGNTIYVADTADGSITLIQDVSVPPPPSPTPTITPSPYPTLPPTRPVARNTSRRATRDS